MPKLVTYGTLVRVGKAILTEAQQKTQNSISSLTGRFRGYVSNSRQLSQSILAGDFYIANDVFTITFGSSVLGVAIDSIIIAMKDNPSIFNREDWIVIKSTIVNEVINLKETVSEHVNDKNNPHEVTLIQANGSSITDTTFQNLLSEV